MSGCSAIQPITSPTVTSASLPVITQSEAPMPRLRAMVKTCVPYAPDWLAMAMRPGIGVPLSMEAVKVA